MAFLPPSPLFSHTLPPRNLTPLCCRPPILHSIHPRATLSPEPSPSSTEPPTTVPIPSSLSDAASQAITAAEVAFSQGKNRIFVEVDLTAGDATYTLLKSTLPLIRLLTPLFTSGEGKTIHVILPDAGSAALALRDWEDAPENVSVKGLEQAQIGEDDAGVIIVAPRASDVDLLPSVVESAKDLPIVIVNPDLVDMGVTGLSLNARRLRIELIDTFVVAYYLKTFGWGVLLRAFPGNWGIWVDAQNEVGFRLVGEVAQRPSNETIEEVLESEGEKTSGIFDKIGRFLNLYMRG